MFIAGQVLGRLTPGISFPSGDESAALLLDDFPAYAGYSNRLLKTGETQAMELRESSGGTLADIGFSGVDFDEAAATTHVGSNDGTFSKWYNQEGTSSRDLAQTTVVEQPFLMQSGVFGTLGTNSKSTMYSTSKDMGVQNATWGSIGTNDPRTVFIVVRPDVTAGNSNEIYGRHTSTSVAFGATNHDIQVHQTGGGDSSIYADGNPYVMCVFRSTSATQVWLNNVLVYDTLVDLTSFITTLAVLISYANGNRGLNGAISEFVLYDGDERSNRVGIQDNMNNYYGIY